MLDTENVWISRSGGSGNLSVLEGEGCLALSFSKVSELSAAKESSEDNNFRAPRRSPSESLDSTRLESGVDVGSLLSRFGTKINGLWMFFLTSRVREVLDLGGTARAE